MDQGVSIINTTINLAAKTAVNEHENLIFWGRGEMTLLDVIQEDVSMTWLNGKSVTLVRQQRKVLRDGQDTILTESNKEKNEISEIKNLIFKNPGFEDVKKKPW